MLFVVQKNLKKIHKYHLWEIFERNHHVDEILLLLFVKFEFLLEINLNIHFEHFHFLIDLDDSQLLHDQIEHLLSHLVMDLLMNNQQILDDAIRNQSIFEEVLERTKFIYRNLFTRLY